MFLLPKASLFCGLFLCFLVYFSVVSTKYTQLRCRHCDYSVIANYRCSVAVIRNAAANFLA